MKKVTKPVIAAIIYTGIMAIGWALNPYQYGKIDNVIFMIPILVLLSIFSAVMIKKSSVGILPKSTRYPRLLTYFIIILIYLLISNAVVFLNANQFGPIHKMFLLLVSTLLVGFAEEGMYRGYILNTIEKKYNTKKALLYSSILFGLLHGVNFIAGPSFLPTVLQVLLTTAMGYVFGTIYLKSNKNLALVMLLHGVYDFLVFNFGYLKEINNSQWLNSLMLPLLVMIWVICIKTNKAEKI